MTATWYPLNKFTCPAVGCESRGKGSWRCKSDGTQTYISQTGYIRCESLIHCGLMCNWGWNCGNHGNHPVHKYRTADMQGFGFALSQAVSLMDEAGSTWVAALVNEVGKQFKYESGYCS